jgi:hypothetical protein
MKKGDIVIGKIDAKIENFNYIKDIDIQINKRYIISDVYRSNFLDNGTGILYLYEKKSIICIDGSCFPYGEINNNLPSQLAFENFFISLAEHREEKIASIFD